MYALIQKSDNKILKIGTEGPVLASEKPFYWVSCPDNCNTQWTFDGETFTPPEPVVPTPEQVIEQYTAAIQDRLDAFAKTRNYDGILSACTYASSPTEKFATEGQYCVEQRDATWLAAYAILDDVNAGNRPMPTLEELFNELPVLAWPN